MTEENASPNGDATEARAHITALSEQVEQLTRGRDQRMDDLRAQIEQLTRERDAALAMSRCECSSDEAWANIEKLLNSELAAIARANQLATELDALKAEQAPAPVEVSRPVDDCLQIRSWIGTARESINDAGDATAKMRRELLTGALESLRKADTALASMASTPMGEPKCSPTLTECPRCKNVINKCDGVFAAPAVEVPADETRAWVYRLNLLESCANWLESRSRCVTLDIKADPEEGGGYESLMRGYAKDLLTIRSMLAAAPPASSGAEASDWYERHQAACAADYGAYDDNASLQTRLRWWVPKSARHGRLQLEDDLLEAVEALAAHSEAEAEPISIAPQAIDAATGKLPHRNIGLCPDELAGFDSRDPGCAACRALVALATAAPSGAEAQKAVADYLHKLRFIHRVLGNFIRAPLSDRSDAYAMARELIESTWKKGAARMAPSAQPEPREPLIASVIDDVMRECALDEISDADFRALNDKPMTRHEQRAYDRAVEFARGIERAHGITAASTNSGTGGS